MELCCLQVRTSAAPRTPCLARIQSTTGIRVRIIQAHCLQRQILYHSPRLEIQLPPPRLETRTSFRIKCYLPLRSIGLSYIGLSVCRISLFRLLSGILCRFFLRFTSECYSPLHKKQAGDSLSRPCNLIINLKIRLRKNRAI